MQHRRFLLPCALLLMGALGHAQSNAVPGIDLELSFLDGLTALDRTGTYPDGVNGCAMMTTSCNQGTLPIPWRAVMDPAHPFIAFLVARRSGGRFVQISDRSWVKHGFFALSIPGCGPCSATDGTTLGVGCSDTYGSGNNGDSYYLGPPDEIDPWLGTWEPACSYFDRGDPTAAPPLDCNGERSLTRAQVGALGPLGHRIRLSDADLAVPNASFYFQAMYVVGTEAEATRGDNIAHRGFDAVWNGTRWVFAPSQDGFATVYGSVLSRWTGASVQSATNGAEDGRLYVAARVTGPTDGFWHYEYAVHNRDNARGVDVVRIPICPGARVREAGFSDVDDDAGNDWHASVAGSELVWTGATNPLDWNTIYNFWFDSDAAPAAAALVLDQATPGPGQPSVLVASSAPLQLFNVYTGPGCSLARTPDLVATGSPPRATLGNARFALSSTGNAPFQPGTLYFSRVPGSFALGSCRLYLGPGGTVEQSQTVLSDAAGTLRYAIPIPSDVSLEGLEVDLQVVARRPGSGTLFGDYELSDGLRVRVGSSIGDCP